LRLPLAKHTVSDLLVGGLSFGRAHPVRTGEHRGAQLEDVSDNCNANDALSRQGVIETMSVN
jgi:flagellar motor switch protein FliM